MQHDIWLPSGYEPIDRSLIPSRSDMRDDMRGPGLLVLEVPGLSINWTLRPDKRDVRRWRAVDLAGVVQAHAAWPRMLRDLAARQAQGLGRRHW
jgi:hypothetical protein